MPVIADARFEELEKKVVKILEKFKLLEDINRNTQILNGKIENVLHEIDGIKNKIEENVKNINTTTKKMETMEAECRILKEKADQLRFEMEEFKYEKICNDIEIIGLPDSNIVDIGKNIIEFGKKISCVMNNTDITKIKKNPGRQGKNHYVTITLATNEMKQKMLNSFKKCKLSADQIGYANCTNKVYFNEAITPLSKQILFHARNFRKEKAWKFVWTKNGKVYLRQGEHSPAVLVKSMNDIETLSK